MNINYSKIVCVLWLLLVVANKSYCQNIEYVQLYPNECKDTKEFYQKNKTLFDVATKNIGLTSQFLFAIVSPEITQYSYLSNKLEIYSLKVLYVQNGKAYSDFSIGYFQMKPSFVELLEKTATEDSILKVKYATCLFANPEKRAARVTRVDRLNTVEWQVIYLSLFCEILQKRFNTLTFTTIEEQLRFYASAYNCGFHKSEQQIKETEQKALFPHFSRQKFKYSNIAVWFYRDIME